jgi:hypothetical protein
MWVHEKYLWFKNVFLYLKQLCFPKVINKFINIYEIVVYDTNL